MVSRVSDRVFVRSCVEDVYYYLSYLQTESPMRFVALRKYLVENKSPKEIEYEVGIPRGRLSGVLSILTSKCGRRSLALEVAKRLLLSVFKE